MPLDEVDRAWVRFIALRDQLLAARDDENRRRRTEVTLTALEADAEADTEIDLRESVANPHRTRLIDGNPR